MVFADISDATIKFTAHENVNKKIPVTTGAETP